MKPQHTCHITDCNKGTHPSKLMCPGHWVKVPAKLQTAVYDHYRPGQCNDKRPSKEWFQAARESRMYVEKLEAGMSVAEIEQVIAKSRQAWQAVQLKLGEVG